MSDSGLVPCDGYKCKNMVSTPAEDYRDDNLCSECDRKEQESLQKDYDELQHEMWLDDPWTLWNLD